ncbi:15605_t:CDS:2 [Dentiscutata heterogama]|uniref:15605_t:CDS:1 n=1 Tax=Dentiscutata heterogama TaxID=1316150 RepID=A0ACA9LC29_9GLOM|nr:15605_t:CDS:2 [Dentiscutata heterogama]
MIITEKRGLTQLYSECYYTYSPKDLLRRTCLECFEEMQKRLTEIQKEAKGQICKVTKYNEKSGKVHPTQENEIQRKNQNSWWTVYEIIKEEIEQLPNVSIMNQYEEYKENC